MADANRVVVDLGAGDGRAVLARARAEADARVLVIGIDANAAGLAETSRRAARPRSRDGAPNALFVVAAAERLPAELLGIADELTILFPWGSLLSGTLAIDDAAAAGIASLLQPGACLSAYVSLTPRDGLAVPSLDEPGAADALAVRWACHGLRLESITLATPAELKATGSTWARRLRAGSDPTRPAWRLALRRDGGLHVASQDAPATDR